METAPTAREKALSDYRKKLSEHREVEARLKESMLNLQSVMLLLYREIFPSCLERNVARARLVNLVTISVLRMRQFLLIQPLYLI